LSAFVPFAGLFLLLAPILVVFYLLKVRRQDHEVASTLLWRHLTRDVTAHEPWQRLRWNPLLLLQILVLTALVAALIRPYLRLPGTAAGFEVVVIDGSASMAAADVSPSRFDAAKAAARSIVAHLGAGIQAAVIETGDSPRTLVGATADHGALNAALDAAHPTVSQTQMRNALELALALAKAHPGGRIDIISDGAFGDVSDLGSTGVPIHFIAIGGRGDNQAITALSARPDPVAPNRYTVFVRVDNDSTTAAANVLSLLADGRLVDTKPVTAAAGATQGFVFDKVPTGAQVVEARLGGKDSLLLDNQAFLLLHQQAPARVLLVTNGNPFLLAALRYMPISLFQATTSQLGLVNADTYDVVVLDGVVPPILPKGNLLLVNPPNTPLLPSAGAVGPLQVTSERTDDPVLQYVNLTSLVVRSGEKVTPPGWARVLADDNGAPLLLVGQTQGHTIAALPFSLQQSNLPLLSAFPILLANVMDFLAPGQTADIVNAPSGGPLLIQPLPQATRIEVQRPDHSVVAVPMGQGPSVAYADTDEVGLYVVTEKAGSRVLFQQTYAVNLLSSRESDIRPATAPSFANTTSDANLAGTGGPTVAPFELWPYVALLAALLLMAEWWWYHRRA